MIRKRRLFGLARYHLDRREHDGGQDNEPQSQHVSSHRGVTPFSV
jgi:hypothetical protein